MESMKEVKSNLVEIKLTTTTTTKIVENTRKRSVDVKEADEEDELVPLLVRLPSDSPSCSSNCIRIDKDQFKIGRKSDNDEIILSVWISRNHCTLQRDENGWSVTNLSSTDTLLNNVPIDRNNTQPIKDGDILQLSLSDSFKYKFTFAKKKFESTKYPRLESSNCELGNVLNKQRSFVEYQENQRKDLEKQLITKQQEQEQLKQELEQLLQDQKVTKTCNEKLNNEIEELQKRIENGSSTELELQQKYRDLLQQLEKERLKFEEILAKEKQKWQETLRETKQEKEQLEMSMVEQMEEWREQLQKKQEEEWQKKIDNLLQEEKVVQTKLQDEKQLLEQKVKEMEEALKEREQQVQAQQNAMLLMAPPIDMQNCIVVEVESKTIQDFPILETIDLTDENKSMSSSFKSCQEEAIINKVNNIMDEQLTCSICSELFIRAMTLNCTHTFCRHCIDSWIKKRRDCPNCRTPIVSMTRSLVVDNFIEKMLESLTPEEMQKRKQLIEERKASTKSRTIIKKIIKKR